MNLQIYAKGTKLRLTKDWNFQCHKDGYGLMSYSPTNSYTLQAGTILSIHDIDIRGNCKVPRSVCFLIPKKGCPSDDFYESQTFHVDFNQLDNLEFELNSKADLKLNSIKLKDMISSINEELNVKEK